MNNDSKTFEGFLMVTDLDGTLLDKQLHIAQKNIEAIRRFIAKGGSFTLATGRHFGTAQRFYEAVTGNAPAILLNGCVLYDFEHGKPIYEKRLDKETGEGVKKIIERFPTLGVNINASDSLYIIRENSLVKHHLKLAKMKYKYSGIDDVTVPWYKFLLIVEEEDQVDEVKQYAQAVMDDKVRVVQSAPQYLEILPAGVNKSTLLDRLISYLNVDRSKVCAIGDYYNDFELLSVSGISAVPETAPEELKNIADTVVCNCEQGSVAEFIEYLEKRFAV